MKAAAESSKISGTTCIYFFFKKNARVRALVGRISLAIILPAIAARALLLLLLLLRPSGTSAFVLSMSHYVFFDCDDCCYQVSYLTGRNWN